MTYEYRFISQASIAIDLQFSRLTPHSSVAALGVASNPCQEARCQKETGRGRNVTGCGALLNSKDTLSLRRLSARNCCASSQWRSDQTIAGRDGTVEGDLVTLLAKQQLVSDATAPVTARPVAAITGPAWHDAVLFGEFVKFMQQAIEWENLLYFLYPYFWGSEMVGRDK